LLSAAVDTVAAEDVVSAVVVDMPSPVVAEVLAAAGSLDAALPVVVAVSMAVEGSGTEAMGTADSDSG
jgi:hypothetical protein